MLRESICIVKYFLFLIFYSLFNLFIYICICLWRYIDSIIFMTCKTSFVFFISYFSCFLHFFNLFIYLSWFHTFHDIQDFPFFSVILFICLPLFPSSILYLFFNFFICLPLYRFCASFFILFFICLPLFPSSSLYLFYNLLICPTLFLSYF